MPIGLLLHKQETEMLEVLSNSRLVGTVSNLSNEGQDIKLNPFPKLRVVSDTRRKGETNMFKKSFLMPLNLQFFAADTGAGEGGGTGDTGNTNDGGNTNNQSADNGATNTNQNDGGNKQDHMIPKTRFDEINSKYKEVQTKLDEFLKQQSDKQLEEQKQKGEFEKLYNETKENFDKTNTEFEGAKSRVEQLEGIIGTMLETKLTEVPEEFHDLIPANLTVEGKLEWIANAQAKGLFGTKEDKSNKPLGQSTNQTNDKEVDTSKMSIGELFKAAYGRK
jgi:hypothetical protein